MGEVVSHCCHSLHGCALGQKARGAGQCFVQGSVLLPDLGWSWERHSAHSVKEHFFGSRCYSPLPGVVGSRWAELLWELCCCSPRLCYFVESFRLEKTPKTIKSNE